MRWSIIFLLWVIFWVRMLRFNRILSRMNFKGGLFSLRCLTLWHTNLVWVFGIRLLLKDLTLSAFIHEYLLKRLLLCLLPVLTFVFIWLFFHYFSYIFLYNSTSLGNFFTNFTFFIYLFFIKFRLIFWFYLRNIFLIYLWYLIFRRLLYNFILIMIFLLIIALSFEIFCLLFNTFLIIL